MAGKTQDRLLDTFREAAGSGGGTSGASESSALPQALDKALSSTVELATSLGVMSAGTSAGAGNGTAELYGTSASTAGSNVAGGPAGSSTDSSGGGTSVASVATTFFESGFGMAALVKGLMGLFTGGSDAPAPLEKYQMPSAISFESADSGGQMSAVDYDQMGQARAVSPDPSTGGAGAGGAQSPQVTVNVQAMDAQSFLDHSSAIADAVRGAMLNMSSINDVVNEL